MASPVLSLKALSLGTISKQIWQIQDLSAALIPVSYASDSSKLIILPNDVRDSYNGQLIPIYEAIMTMQSISEAVRAQIACVFKKLEENMFQWAIDLKRILRKPETRNIAYCLSKTVVRMNLTVDRETTLFNVLFDSHGRVKLCRFETGKYCVLSVTNLHKFIENGMYRQYNELSRKMFKKLKELNPLSYWRLATRITCRVQGLKYSKMDLLLNATVNSRLEVFKYVLYKLRDQFHAYKVPSKIWCLLLSHVLLFDDTRCELDFKSINYTFIYLLEKLHQSDEEAWKNMLLHWHRLIISWTFRCGNAEYCVIYFNEIRESLSIEDCVETVSELLENLFRLTSKPLIKRAKFLERSSLFLDIWMRIPNLVKQKMIDTLESLTMHTMNDEFAFLSILLSDSAFSVEQRDYLILIKVLSMQKSQRDDVETFLSHFPDCDRSFSRVATAETLTKYARNFNICNDSALAYVLKSEAELDAFKEKLFENEDYVVEIISKWGDSLVDSNIYSDLLLWGLKNEESVKRFIKEKIIGQQWIVEIVKRNLLWMLCCGNSFSFVDFFVEDAEQKLAFKNIIREDVQFMLKMFDAIFYDGQSWLPDFLAIFFEPAEVDEKRNLVEAYIASDKGLQAIRSLLTAGDELKHALLYLKHKLKNNMYSMKALKDYWLEPFQLTEKVVDIVNSTKIEGKIPTLWPHQTDEDFRIIRTWNRFMFESILTLDVAVDILYDRFAAEVSEQEAYHYQLQDDFSPWGYYG